MEKRVIDLSVVSSGIALPKDEVEQVQQKTPDFKPFNDLLLVRAEHVVPGAIKMPSGSFSFEIGIILAMGPGAYQAGVRCETGLSVGDRILVEKSHVLDVNIDGEKLYLVKPGQVQGVLGAATVIDVRKL